MTQSLRNVAYLHKFTKKDSFILFFRFSHSFDTTQYVFLHTKRETESSSSGKKKSSMHIHTV